MKILTNEELKDLDLTKILKVGDEVWDIRFGKGIVKEIDTDCYAPILVEFDCSDYIRYYKNGFYSIDDLYPSLYLYEIPIPEYKIPITFEKDELVWVKYHNKDEWRIRYYDKHLENYHYVFNEQRKYNDCKGIEPQPENINDSSIVFEIRKFSDNPLL